MLLVGACVSSRQAVKPTAKVCAALGSEVVYVENPSYVSFIPFGAGQLQNGHVGKGVAFGAAQVATGATSAGIFVYLASRYGLEARVPLSEGPRVRTLQQIEIASGLVFFALYAAGVIDALYHHQRYVPRCAPTFTATR